jgi:hypothetical protein
VGDALTEGVAMARIVIVADGDGAHSIADPIVLAGVVQSTALAFSPSEALDNELVAEQYERDVAFRGASGSSGALA